MTRERGYLAVAGVIVLAAILLFFCVVAFNTRPMSLETTPRETSPREGVSPETAFAAENISPPTYESQSPPTVADPEPAKRKTATVSGSVTDAGYEEPIENAAVRFCARDDSEQYRIETTTDTDGKYSMQVPAGAEFSILFSKQFFDAVESEIMVLDSGAEYDLDIAMVQYPYVDLKINVTDATTGIPLGDFWLEFVGERGQKPGGYWWTRDSVCRRIRIKPSNGVFFESYVLSAKKIGYRIYASDEIVPTGREHKVDIVLEPCRTTLSGIVTDSDTGCPLSEVSVYLDGSSASMIAEYADETDKVISDYAGRFSFEVLPDDHYQLSCAHPRYDWFDELFVEAVEGEESTFNIELVPLSGLVCVGVFDAKTGNPVGDAFVYIDGPLHDYPEGITDNEGLFESSEAPRGNSEVDVRKDGYLSVEIKIENITSERVKYVDVYLRPLDALIRGNVIDAATGLVPGIDFLPSVCCFISNEDNSSVSREWLWAKVAEDGTYSLRVPSGELEIGCICVDYLDPEDVVILIDSGEEVEIDFVLELFPELTSKIEVRASIGEEAIPAGDFHVCITYRSYELDLDYTWDDYAYFAEIPAGEIVVECQVPRSGYYAKHRGYTKVFVSPGETKEVVVELK